MTQICGVSEQAALWRSPDPCPAKQFGKGLLGRPFESEKNPWNSFRLFHLQITSFRDPVKQTKINQKRAKSCWVE